MLDPSQRYPVEDEVVTPRTPAEYLRKEMQDRSLTAVTLGNILGVHPQTIYNVTGNDPRKISSRLAVALAKHLGHDVDFWLAKTLPEFPEETAQTAPSPLPKEIAALPPESALLPSEPTYSPGLMVDWQLRQALGDDNSGLEIRSPDEIYIRSASIDLTIGKIVVRGYDYLKRDILTLITRFQLMPDVLSASERHAAENAVEFYNDEVELLDEFELKPGESVIIISREDLSFDKGFAGRVGQNTSLLLDGCQILYGLQVDPGFSGPLFVRAVNLLKEENITLKAKDVLLSLEVRSLLKRPTKVHQGALDRRIALIADKVYGAIGELFETKSRAHDLPYKATFKGQFQKKFVRENDEDVKAMAIAWVVATLADASSVARPEVEVMVEDALDAIPVLPDEAEALAVSVGIRKDLANGFDAVLGHFEAERAQSLLDTIGWMDKKPSDIVIALLQHDAVKGHAWQHSTIL